MSQVTPQITFDEGQAYLSQVEGILNHDYFAEQMTLGWWR